jgi:Xaa-Pro aminopeptidase
MAHHRPGDRVVADGDVVVIDVGARVDGYCSDMTRSFFVGEVDARLVEMYDAVIESQRTGVEAVRAGATAHEVDRACREVFVARGVSEFYVHGTGHGVGLEIHEHPILSPGVDVELLVDEVVTVEPGLYREGLGGVRIEDLVVVSREGATSLTHAPKDPACPPSRRTT